MDENRYLTLDINKMPCGKFYPHGILVKFRASVAKEIEAYSMVDIENLYDVREKVEQILRNNIIIKDIFEVNLGYEYLKQADREYMLFIIRELTFQNGNTLAYETTCKNCSNKYNIYYRTTSNNTHEKTIYNKEMDDKIKKYFDDKKGYFEVKIGDYKYKLSPPSVGLTKSIKRYKETVEDDSFLKLIAYMLPNVTILSIKEISDVLEVLKIKINMRTYQILRQFISRMNFGFGTLESTCNNCKNVNIEDIVEPYDVDLFGLFKVDLMNFIDNEFEFWYSEKMNLDYLENMPYWKYEEFVKKLNIRKEEENKRNKEQNKAQNNTMSGFKTPNIKSPKI